MNIKQRRRGRSAEGPCGAGPRGRRAKIKKRFSRPIAPTTRSPRRRSDDSGRRWRAAIPVLGRSAAAEARVTGRTVRGGWARYAVSSRYTVALGIRSSRRTVFAVYGRRRGRRAGYVTRPGFLFAVPSSPAALLLRRARHGGRRWHVIRRRFTRGEPRRRPALVRRTAHAWRC